MDEDDGFLTSDAELDSEVEDNDDSELSMWLDQLNAIQQDGQPAKRRPPVPVKPRTLSSLKQGMDDLRSSVMTNSGGGDVDLDAILGELCELSTQLNVSLQTESKSNSTRQSAPAVDTDTKYTVKEYGDPVPSTVTTNHTSVTTTTNQPDLVTNFDSSNDLDLQLLSALSELTALAGSTFDDSADTGSSTCSVATVQNGTYTEQSQTEAVASHCVRQPSVNDNETRCKQNGGIAMAIASSKQVCSRPISGGSIGHSRQLSVDASMHDSSPDGCDVDSAFSDNTSLPSSGSHVSVATTSSQNSASSSGVGVSSSPIPAAEQAAKLKEEKVRLALEKIKEANIKKLFVRIYTLDNSCKSILVDETMTVAQICDILVVKNHYNPSVHWSVVEELPEIFMERLVEDHEFLVENLLPWTRDSTNRLIFLERPDKYDVFLKPERYLLADTDADQRDYKEDERQILIQEYFGSGQARIPRVETTLYLKLEGKKAWKKYHFVLRASGIYYNPKGKSKSSKDLVCLQKLDYVEVYTSLGWKKKYKAPTEHGFALKHARIQKKTSKYIKYLCAEDAATVVLWTTAIRVAKFGEQLKHNYDSAKENVTTWDPSKVPMEPNKVAVDTSSVAKDKYLTTSKPVVHAKKLPVDSGRVAMDTREVAMDTREVAKGSSMVNMDTSRCVDNITVENNQSVATTTVAMDMDKVVMETNRQVVETIKVSTSPVKRVQLPAETMRQSSFVDNVPRTPTKANGGGVSSPLKLNGNTATRQDSDDSSVAKMAPMLPVTTETTRHIAEQCLNTIKRSPKPNGNVERAPSLKKPAPPMLKKPAPPVSKKPMPPPTPPKSMAVLQAQSNQHDFPAPPSPHTLQTFQLDGATELAEDVPDGCLPGALSRNRFPSGSSTHSRGSFRVSHTPPAVAVKPQSPRPASQRPLSSPTPDSPQPNGGSPWHRRTSSGPVSPAISAAKPKPPPPPKRGLHTKLSFHGDSAVSKNFMADLQRKLAQKQQPRPGNKPPTPLLTATAESGLVRGESMSDLPPPPPELMEGLEEASAAGKKRVPPPPPKRSRATHLTTNK